jgi:hypothetical protein
MSSVAGKQREPELLARHYPEKRSQGQGRQVEVQSERLNQGWMLREDLGL